MDDSIKALDLKKKGNECFVYGKYEEAIDYYMKAIAICPNEDLNNLSLLYCNRALALNKLHRYTMAIEDSTVAFSLNAKYDKALYCRYKARMALDQFNDALADITAVCLLQKEVNKTVVSERNKLLTSLSAVEFQLFKRSNIEMVSLNSNIKWFLSLFSHHPLLNSSFDRDKLLKFLEDLKMTDKKRIENYDAKIALVEGTIAFFSKKHEVGELLYGMAINAVHNDDNLKIIALLKLAALKLNQLHTTTGFSPSQLKMILQIFDRAIAIDSNNENIYCHRSFVHFFSGNSDKAFSDLRRCISLCPSFEAPHLLLFNHRFHQVLAEKNLAEYLLLFRDIEEYINQHPNSSEIHAYYALILLKMKQFKKAEEMISKAISIDKNDSIYYIYKSNIVKELTKNPREVIPYLISAISVDNQCTEAYLQLSEIEANEGNLRNAIIYVDKVLANSNDDFRLSCLRVLLLSRLQACEILKIKNSKDCFSKDIVKLVKEVTEIFTLANDIVLKISPILFSSPVYSPF